MSYRTLPPVPGGRRERRLMARARVRTYRQVGTSLVVVAVAAGSFSTAGAADIADRWLPQDAQETTTVAQVTAEAVSVEVSTVTTENAIANGTVEQADTSAKTGTRRVIQAGVPGVELVSYTVTKVNGVEVDRAPGISVLVSEPTDEVIAVGALTIPPATDVEKGSNRETGKLLAEQLYGWTGDEWACLDNLWARESGWSHTAGNKSSGAYGIPQALPGDKMSSFGADWQTNPATQIQWGLSYVSGRYSTPCGAWGHFTAKNWY